MLKQGFELGIYFSAIAGNGPSYSTLYYQASKGFYHSVQYLLYMLCPFILNQLPFFYYTGTQNLELILPGAGSNSWAMGIRVE